MKYKPVFSMLCLLVFLSAEVSLAAKADPRESIVKIYTYFSRPDYYNPWSTRGSSASTGSGCVIEGKKILTNAHVVSDQTYLQVRRFGDAKRYQARVLNVSHHADLAVLTVDDPSFFEGIPALKFGELPHPQDEVLVYGFPLGGDTLSTTKGVVSRLEHQHYAHSSAAFLAGQIDAAINPGNSGGPVLSDGKIVGVVMQSISRADNIGYMVPVNIVQHFLEDVKDGVYDGFPSSGILLQEMENPDMRRKYGMQPEQSGVLVVKVLQDSPAEGVIKPGDVLLSMQGMPVASDGTIEFRPRERTQVAYLIQERQVGDEIFLEVLREGEHLSLNLKLHRSMDADYLIPMERYDVRPTYYIYGGVVFCPLTKNLVRSWGANWRNNAPKEWLAMLGQNFVTPERDEVVVALRSLAAEVNQGYQGLGNWIVTEVDGEPVHNLKDLIDQVEHPRNGPFITFGNKFGQQMIFDRSRAEASLPHILKTYHIPADRSEDLQTP